MNLSSVIVFQIDVDELAFRASTHDITGSMVTRDSTTSETGGTADDAKPFALVSFEDFRAFDFQAVAAKTDCAECTVLAQLYGETGQIARADGDDQKTRVFGILASVCGQHFSPGTGLVRSGPCGSLRVRDQQYPRTSREHKPKCSSNCSRKLSTRAFARASRAMVFRLRQPKGP